MTLDYSDGDETPCDRIDTWVNEQMAACIAAGCSDCTENSTGQQLPCDNVSTGTGVECKEISVVTGNCESEACEEQGCCWLVNGDGVWELDPSSFCSEECNCPTDGRPPAGFPGMGWCTFCEPV